MISGIVHPRAAALLRFAEGACASGERNRVADHLAACTACRTALMESREIILGAQALPAPPAPDAMLDRIIGERMAGRRVILPADVPVVPRPSRARTVSALVLVVAAVALFVVRFGDRRHGNDQTPVMSQLASHAMFVNVGVLPLEVGAQEPSPPYIRGIDGTRVLPGFYTYELRYSPRTSTRQRIAPERATVVVESTTVDRVPAWRIVHQWHGHATDAPESTYVNRVSLAPLRRRAYNIGPSLFTVVQRFVHYPTGDSLLGTMSTTRSSQPIARFLPADRAPFLVGQGAPLVLLQSVRLNPTWRGTGSVVGWGSVYNDQLYPLQLRVLGEETVHTPGGAFDCWRLRVDGGAGKRGKLAGRSYLWVRKSDNVTVMSVDSTMNGWVKQLVFVSRSDRP